jgi:hypothetical protein
MTLLKISQPLVRGVTGASSLVVERQEHEAQQSTHYSADVKNCGPTPPLLLTSP